MNWKNYKIQFENGKMSEDYFVLGVDMGASSSSIAYFDHMRGQAEVLDISGGYGKPNPPTALQYLSDTKEWIFGEYAILNANGQDALLNDFMQSLGPAVYLDTGAGSKSVIEIASIYLRELIENCKSINPKASVAGIVGVVPDFIGQDAIEALKAAYTRAKLDRVLIELVQERHALLSYCYHTNIVSNYKESYFDTRSAPKSMTHILWLDFGARGLRGGLYDVTKGYDEIACLSSGLSEKISMSKVDEEIYNLLAGFYSQQLNLNINHLTKAQEEELLSFAYGHKDVLFNQTAGRETRLYYNFVHPPFAKSVSAKQISDLTTPWANELEKFTKSMLNQHEQLSNIKIICTGGGFEMPWAKQAINNIFKDKHKAHFIKNTKGVLAQGATLYAASKMSLLPQPALSISDSHKLPWDIGINVSQDGKSRFYPLMERGSWLWQKPKPVYLIAKEGDASVDLFVRHQDGVAAHLGTATLKGLPNRPAGTTKISIEIEAKDIYNYAVSIKDLGFGKIFPSTGYVEKYTFKAQGGMA